MNNRDFRDTAIVIISLGAAMATGFLRQSALAATLGIGRDADIFLVAYALPEFVYVALPIILSPVIIPLFMQVRSQRGEAAAWLATRRLGTWLLAGILVLTVLAAVSAPLFLTWLSPGFSSSDRSRALDVFFPMLPAIFLMGASTLVSALLQVYRRFARPALTTAVFNLVFIASLLALPLDPPLARTGWAVSLGALAALLFQLPLFLQVRKQISGEAPTERVELKPAFLLIGWMAAGYGAHHLILFIDRAMATAQGAGSAAVLNFGYHLALTIGQVSGLAVSTVLFPALSEQIASGDLPAARRALSRALGAVLALAMPAGLGAIVLRTQIVQVLLEYGAFTAADTRAVETPLAIYTAAVVADALCQPLWRLVYAWKVGPMVLAVNGTQTLVRLAANIILVNYFGYNGIAISAVIGLTLQLVILMGLAHKRLAWNIPYPDLRWSIDVTLSAGFAALAVLLLKAGVTRFLPQPSPWWILIIGGAALLLSYTALLTGVFRRPLYRKEGFAVGKD